MKINKKIVLAVIGTVMTLATAHAQAALTPNALSVNALTPNALSANGLAPNSMVLNGLSANGLAKKKLTPQSDISTQKGLSEASTGLSSVSTIELTQTGLESSKLGRDLLKYIIGCAMPKDVTLHASFQKKDYSFPGNLGLAPEWLHNGMDTKAERWVSACVLARTNYFGQPIQISLRSDKNKNPALAASPKELKDYTLYEGGFFGNIFGKFLKPYTCLGERSQKNNADDILKWRVCTEDSGVQTPAGQKISKCNFIITGACNDPKNLKVAGETYDEVIKVYLKPGLSSLLKKQK